MKLHKIVLICFIIYIVWYSLLSVNVWDKTYTKFKILDYLPDCYPNKLSQSLFKKSYDTKLLE